MRRWIALAIALLLFSAAGVQQGFSAPKTSVLLWNHWGGEQGAAFEQLVSSFNKTVGEKEGIVVNVAAVSDEETVPKLMASKLSGTLPDVIHYYSTSFLVDNDLVSVPPKEIQDYIKKNYRPQAVEGAVYKDALWGYPTEFHVTGLIYRKSWLKNAGLPVPRTWAELETAMKALTKYDSNGNRIQVGLAADNSDGYFDVLFTLASSAGLDLFDVKNKRSNFDTETGRKVMNLFLGAMKNGYTNFGFLDVWQVYTSQKCGMIIQNPWFAKLLIKDQGEKGVYEDTAVTYVPTPTGKNFASESAGWTMCVAKESKARNAAWKFVRWLNDGPEYRFCDLLVNTIGGLPSPKGFNKYVGWNPDVLSGFLKCADVARRAPMISAIGQVFQILQIECEKAGSGQQSIDDTIKILQSKIDKLLLETQQ